MDREEKTLDREMEHWKEEIVMIAYFFYFPLDFLGQEGAASVEFAAQ